MVRFLQMASLIFSTRDGPILDFLFFLKSDMDI